MQIFILLILGKYIYAIMKIQKVIVLLKCL